MSETPNPLKFSCPQCGRYMDAPCEHWKSWMESQKRRTNMQPHQQRVVTELEELNEKRSKLDTFLKGDIFKSLNGDEQLRLAKQFRVMGEYAEILYQRIANFA